MTAPINRSRAVRDRPEADQGDIVDLDVARRVFADVLKDGPAHEFRPARGLGQAADQAAILPYMLACSRVDEGRHMEGVTTETTAPLTVVKIGNRG